MTEDWKKEKNIQPRLKILTCLIVAMIAVSIIIVYIEHDTENSETRFEWEYAGIKFKLNLELDLDPYLFYDPNNTDRVPDTNSDTRGSNIINYVSSAEGDTEVISLSDKLIELYNKNFSVHYLGQNYVGYILSFIRSNFIYESDFVLYAKLDYIALPIETLLKRAGDCEDFAVLCASLLYYAGFDVGIIVFKNHAIAAVKLDSFEVSDTEYELCEIEHESSRYYGCEATPYTYCPVGYIDLDLVGDSENPKLYTKSNSTSSLILTLRTIEILRGDYSGFYEQSSKEIVSAVPIHNIYFSHSIGLEEITKN